jgi:hypothetical protein
VLLQSEKEEKEEEEEEEDRARSPPPSPAIDARRHRPKTENAAADIS